MQIPCLPKSHHLYDRDGRKCHSVGPMLHVPGLSRTSSLKGASFTCTQLKPQRVLLKGPGGKGLCCPLLSLRAEGAGGQETSAWELRTESPGTGDRTVASLWGSRPAETYPTSWSFLLTERRGLSRFEVPRWANLLLKMEHYSFFYEDGTES